MRTGRPRIRGTGLHDYSQPCWGQAGCSWTLAPEVVVPYTFADYRALRDPALEYVLDVAVSEYSGISPGVATGRR
jgi:hypothetical protein